MITHDRKISKDANRGKIFVHIRAINDLRETNALRFKDNESFKIFCTKIV